MANRTVDWPHELLEQARVLLERPVPTAARGAHRRRVPVGAVRGLLVDPGCSPTAPASADLRRPGARPAAVHDDRLAPRPHGDGRARHSSAQPLRRARRRVRSDPRRRPGDATARTASPPSTPPTRHGTSGDQRPRRRRAGRAVRTRRGSVRRAPDGGARPAHQSGGDAPRRRGALPSAPAPQKDQSSSTKLPSTRRRMRFTGPDVEVAERAGRRRRPSRRSGPARHAAG